MSDIQRIEVGLLPKVASELELAMAITGDRQPDVINRAISLYGAVMSMAEMGGGNAVEFVHVDGSTLRLKLSRPRARRWWSR